MHSQKMSDYVLGAYPQKMGKDVRAVLRIIKPEERYRPAEYDRAVSANSEQLVIPYRIYFPEPDDRLVSRLSHRQKAILATLYTRHADGYIREKWLKQVPADESWQAPFIALLIGEYVIEIIRAMRSCEQFDKEFFSDFVRENLQVCEQITARAITYWDYFYSGAKKSLVQDQAMALAGFTVYTFVKEPPSLPLTAYEGYLAAYEYGIWQGRKPRRKSYRQNVS